MLGSLSLSPLPFFSAAHAWPAPSPPARPTVPQRSTPPGTPPLPRSACHRAPRARAFPKPPAHAPPCSGSARTSPRPGRAQPAPAAPRAPPPGPARPAPVPRRSRPALLRTLACPANAHERAQPACPAPLPLVRAHARPQLASRARHGRLATLARTGHATPCPPCARTPLPRRTAPATLVQCRLRWSPPLVTSPPHWRH
jgi:hypothetical protein